LLLKHAENFVADDVAATLRVPLCAVAGRQVEAGGTHVE